MPFSASLYHYLPLFNLFLPLFAFLCLYLSSSTLLPLPLPLCTLTQISPLIKTPLIFRQLSLTARMSHNDAMEETDGAAAPLHLPSVRLEMTDMITKLRHEHEGLSDKVEDNSTRITSLDRKLEKEKLERELEGMKGEFRIIGYRWSLAELGRPGSAARRRFVSNLIRKAFINLGLIDEEIADSTPIDDLRPLGWKDGNPLVIKFGDQTVFHGIKERLPKVKHTTPSTLKIRENRPIILENMHNDLLRFRRSLLNDNNARTIYVEEKNYPPYLSLTKKVITNGAPSRSSIDVEWSDARFLDPILNHDAYAREIRQQAAGRRNGSFGAANLRGYQRGRGTPRGAGRNRGGRPNSCSQRNSQSQ